jgi:hypothetical protein
MMAAYIWDKKGFCRAKTRNQQKICRLGDLDKFDDHCQFMMPDLSCSLAGKQVNGKGEVVPVQQSL